MSLRVLAQSLVKPLGRILVISLLFPLCVQAADDLATLLPPVSCGTGWMIQGKPLNYDKETLSDLINGEAELYFPFGFDRLAAARYASQKIPTMGMDVEIYRMGSLLDAFGIYANYRQQEGRDIPSGAEASLSGTQLFLYQGRYFIRVQLTGASEGDPDVLVNCARAVTSRLPGTRNRPQEVMVFDMKEVVKGSERYLPQSLLGYDFFPNGIKADATVDGNSLQIFHLLGTTSESASTAFDLYRSQLSDVVTKTANNNSIYLEGVDPLYGPVMMVRKGSCLAGAIKFAEKKGVRLLLERVCR